MGGEDVTETLMHYGVKGQKWGVRRYQNEDGSLTETGKKRYYQTSDSTIQSYKNLVTTSSGILGGAYVSKSERERAESNLRRIASVNGLGDVKEIGTVATNGAGGGIEYKLTYRGKEYGVDEFEKLKEALEQQKLKDAEREEKRAKVRANIDKAAEVVDKILEKPKAAMKKVKELTSSAIEYGVLFVEELFKKIMKHSEIKRMSNDVLIHHGIMGQKWGIRRYQNEESTSKTTSLTNEELAIEMLKKK